MIANLGGGAGSHSSLQVFTADHFVAARGCCALGVRGHLKNPDRLFRLSAPRLGKSLTPEKGSPTVKGSAVPGPVPPENLIVNYDEVIGVALTGR